MSVEEPTKVQLSPEEKRERRKQQLREAQRRFYNAHKRKERPETPVSYNPEYIRTYHKNYYQANKEKIATRAREYYHQRKSSDEDKSD